MAENSWYEEITSLSPYVYIGRHFFSSTVQFADFLDFTFNFHINRLHELSINTMKCSEYVSNHFQNFRMSWKSTREPVIPTVLALVSRDLLAPHKPRLILFIYISVLLPVMYWLKSERDINKSTSSRLVTASVQGQRHDFAFSILFCCLSPVLALDFAYSCYTMSTQRFSIPLLLSFW